jgi:hypothetical protein
MSESDYDQSGRSKPPPPLPVRVSRKSQLMAALRQRTRPIVIENQELAYPFARLLQARESGELVAECAADVSGRAMIDKCSALIWVE